LRQTPAGSPRPFFLDIIEMPDAAHSVLPTFSPDIQDHSSCHHAAPLPLLFFITSSSSFSSPLPAITLTAATPLIIDDASSLY